MWQPIGTAPKDGTVIDVWCECEDHHNGGFRIADVTWEDRYSAFFSEDSGILGRDITHWMHLPHPPWMTAPLSDVEREEFTALARERGWMSE